MALPDRIGGLLRRVWNHSGLFALAVLAAMMATAWLLSVTVGLTRGLYEGIFMAAAILFAVRDFALKVQGGTSPLRTLRLSPLAMGIIPLASLWLIIRLAAAYQWFGPPR